MLSRSTPAAAPSLRSATALGGSAGAGSPTGGAAGALGGHRRTAPRAELRAFEVSSGGPPWANCGPHRQSRSVRRVARGPFPAPSQPQSEFVASASRGLPGQGQGPFRAARTPSHVDPDDPTLTPAQRHFAIGNPFADERAEEAVRIFLFWPLRANGPPTRTSGMARFTSSGEGPPRQWSIPLPLPLGPLPWQSRAESPPVSWTLRPGPACPIFPGPKRNLFLRPAALPILFY